MTGEAPRRRSSDPQIPSKPGLVPPAPGAPEFSGPESHLTQTPVEPMIPSGRSTGTRERRQRDAEWQGPERRTNRFR